MSYDIGEEFDKGLVDLIERRRDTLLSVADIARNALDETTEYQECGKALDAHGKLHLAVARIRRDLMCELDESAHENERRTPKDGIPEMVHRLGALNTKSVYAHDGMICRTETRQGKNLVTHLILNVDGGDGFAEVRIDGDLFATVVFPGGGGHGCKCKMAMRNLHYGVRKQFDKNKVKKLRKKMMRDGGDGVMPVNPPFMDTSCGSASAFATPASVVAEMSKGEHQK